jgi:hypothetical protein
MSENIDQHDRLKEEPFTCQITKDNKVLIYWNGKLVKICRGKTAHQLKTQLISLEPFEIQLLLARVTGNFKRGNEQ